MPTPHSFLRSALVGAALIASGTAHAAVTDDTVDPTHLIAAYHQAVVGHDGAKLGQLFVSEGSAWFSVLPDPALARVRVAKPDTPKLRPGSVAAFVKMVSTTKAQLGPEHTYSILPRTVILPRSPSTIGS